MHTACTQCLQRVCSPASTSWSQKPCPTAATPTPRKPAQAQAPTRRRPLARRRKARLGVIARPTPFQRQIPAGPASTKRASCKQVLQRRHRSTTLCPVRSCCRSTQNLCRERGLSPEVYLRSLPWHHQSPIHQSLSCIEHWTTSIGRHQYMLDSVRGTPITDVAWRRVCASERMRALGKPQQGGHVSVGLSNHQAGVILPDHSFERGAAV
jgi:hypothetical protein